MVSVKDSCIERQLVNILFRRTSLKLKVMNECDLVSKPLHIYSFQIQIFFFFFLRNIYKDLSKLMAPVN